MTTQEIDRKLHASVMKREEVREKAFREEKAKLDEEFHNNLGLGGTEMTAKELRKIIDGDRRMYYRTEELNDKLYMHYKGWREIKNLEGWTGLKTIYAECNAFSRISGLDTCTKIRSLFLQENCISQISGLECLKDLWSMNLSSNFIERIEGLEGCPGLNTLIIAKNKIGFGGVADLEHMAETSLCTLDIQDNKIDDPDVVPEVFMRMPNLRVLYLKGNPCAKKIVNYRKSITVYCKDLRYLDDRPVFEDDRRTAEAFNRGGLEEQRAETKRIREEKTAAHDRNMRAFADMMENAKREKKEREAMRREDKFTDESDPVESFERRAKRMNDQWKEDNKDSLECEQDVYARKCLAAERAGKAAVAKIEGEQKDDEQKATTESREAAAETGAAGDTGAGETDVDVPKKEDTRKLVYEDIWDDAPPAKLDSRKMDKSEMNEIMKAAKAAAEKHLASGKAYQEAAPEYVTTGWASASAANPAGQPESLGPAADGVFMDAMAPPDTEMQRRKAKARAEVEAASAKATAAAASSEGGKPSWHTKYQEQLSKTQAKLEEAAPQNRAAFKPPPRGTTGANGITQYTGWPAASEAPEPKAAAASPAEGAGELDEMD